MNQIKRITTFLAVLAFAGIAGCAGSATKESTGDYVDDTVITTKIKAAIFNEPILKSAEINVQTFKGSVQLSGIVSSRASMVRAVELARGVGGVTSVRDNMRLRN